MDLRDRRYLLQLENLRYVRWAQAHPDCRNFAGIDLGPDETEFTGDLHDRHRIFDLSGLDLSDADFSGADLSLDPPLILLGGSAR